MKTNKELLQELYNQLQKASAQIEVNEYFSPQQMEIMNNTVSLAHCISQELKNRMFGNPPKPLG